MPSILDDGLRSPRKLLRSLTRFSLKRAISPRV